MNLKIGQWELSSMRNQKTHEKKRTAPKKPVEQALEGKERKIEKYSKK